MNGVIKLRRGIHHFVRGELPFEEELELLTEVVESEKWLNHLEMELMLHEKAQKSQKLDSTFPIEHYDKRRYNHHPRKVKGTEYSYSAST